MVMKMDEEKEIIQCCYCPNKYPLDVDKETDLLYDVCGECISKLHSTYLTVCD